MGDSVKILVRGVLAAFALSGALIAGHAAAEEPDLISIGIDIFDTTITEARSDDEHVMNVRLEYRSGYNLVPFLEPYATLHPWVGGMKNTDHGSWIGAGLLVDIPLGDSNFFITPSAGVGAWFPGDSKELGSTLEFRSTVELGYRFENGSRFAVYASHISNAGIEDYNPGADMLGAYVHLPLTVIAAAF